MHRAGRGLVGELNDSIGNPAPCRRAVLIIDGGEFVGTRHAFLKGVIAVALSISCAARQMSISGITPHRSTAIMDKRLRPDRLCVDDASASNLDRAYRGDGDGVDIDTVGRRQADRRRVHLHR